MIGGHRVAGWSELEAAYLDSVCDSTPALSWEVMLREWLVDSGGQRLFGGMEV